MLLLLDTVQPGPWDWLIKWVPAVSWPVFFSVAIGFAWKARGWVNDLHATIKTALSTIATSHAELQATRNDIKRHMDDATDFKETLTDAQKRAEEEFKSAKAAVQSHIATANEIANSIRQLVEAIQHRAEIDVEQFKILRSIGEQQAVLGSNQNNITTGFQRVVEQLINMMKE